MLTSLAVFAATGALAGFLAGLLGIGGGMVLVPALIFSFEAQGVSPSVLTHLAIGTSLASIVLTSISSVRTHHAQGGVDIALFKRLAIGLVIGSWFGAQIAHALPARTLQLIIGIFAVWTGLRMFRGSKPIAADFVGVHLPNRYVFGYGMDVKGAWRNLPAVYAVKGL